MSARKAESRGVQQKRKTTRLKRGRQSDLRPQPPALIAAVEMSHHILDTSVTVHTIPANLPCHLAPSTSHDTPTVIPPLCRARVHSRSMGRSRASLSKNGIRSCIHSYGPFTVQGFEGWPHHGFDSRPGHLESRMARNGHTSSQYLACGCQGHSDPCLSPNGCQIHGIPLQKIVSPRDQSDGPENYMNQPSGI
jgi:hypothetical protein